MSSTHIKPESCKCWKGVSYRKGGSRVSERRAAFRPRTQLTTITKAATRLLRDWQEAVRAHDTETALFVGKLLADRIAQGQKPAFGPREEEAFTAWIDDALEAICIKVETHE